MSSAAISTSHSLSAASRAQGWSASGRSDDGDTAAWARVRAALRAETGDRNFDTWLAPLSLLAVDGDRVTLAAPSAFLADWVAGNFADKLRAHWAAQRPGTRQVVVTVQQGMAPPPVLALMPK